MPLREFREGPQKFPKGHRCLWSPSQGNPHCSLSLNLITAHTFHPHWQEKEASFCSTQRERRVERTADPAASPFFMSNVIYREAGRQEFEQEEVGGKCKSLEVLCFSVAWHGFEKREEGETSAAQGGIPATTTAAAVPRLRLPGGKKAVRSWQCTARRSAGHWSN